MCGGQMRLIVFISEGVEVRIMLEQIGVESEPPHIIPVHACHRFGIRLMCRWGASAPHHVRKAFKISHSK